MADIIIKCGQCGKDSKVSEYAADGAVVCSDCGHPLKLPGASAPPGGRLQMRHMGTEQHATLSGRGMKPQDADEEDLQANTTAAMARVLGDVHKARQKAKNPFAIWSWLAFFGLGGLLIGAQYLLVNGYGEYERFYMIGRLLAVGLVSLLVLIVAFEDGTGQGLLCLFAPLYIIYYAFIRVEYYWLRGLFMAVVLSFATEMYFMRDRAMVTVAQTYVNKFIELGNKQISRASESPDMPPPRKFRRGSNPTGNPNDNPRR